MRILLTGGAGFIGSHVAELAIAHGHDVLVVDDFSVGRVHNLAGLLDCGRLRIRRADMVEPGVLEAACRDFEPATIVHLAGLVSVDLARRQPEANFRLNLESTHRVTVAAVATRVSRIVHASSAAIYGDSANLPLGEAERPCPISAYGAAKASSELLLAGAGMDNGLDTISLRFFNVFGPRQPAGSSYSGFISVLAAAAVQGEKLTLYGDGRQTRDFVAVRDAAAAILAAVEAPGRLSGAFNVCTGIETSLLNLVAVAEDLRGRPVPIVFAPPRPGDIRRSCGDPRAFERASGWRPRVSIREGLAELVGIAPVPTTRSSVSP